MRQFFSRNGGHPNFGRKVIVFQSTTFWLVADKTELYKFTRCLGIYTFFKIRFQVPPYSKFHKKHRPNNICFGFFPQVTEVLPGRNVVVFQEMTGNFGGFFWLFKLPPTWPPQQKPMGSTGLGCSASLGAPDREVGGRTHVFPGGVIFVGGDIYKKNNTTSSPLYALGHL